MEISFGIITDGNSDNRINVIIDSIEKLNIPKYEVVIVGNSNVDRKNTEIINFEDPEGPACISEKKNIITKNIKYENVVYSHDYIVYNEDWYEGYLKYGDNFHVCMNKILNADGTRFRDWIIWPLNENEMDNIVSGHRCIIPYDITHLSKYMYISGSWWMAKKEVMEEFPLNNNLRHCESEDVEWSKRVREKYQFSINKYSTVSFLKQKGISFQFSPPEVVEKLKSFK